MIAMRVMQVVGDAVIEVIAVRHRLVAATGAVDMAGLMAAAVVCRALVGVAAGHLDHVFVDMIAVRVVKVPVVQIVDVAAMAHGGMSAARPMAMGVVGVVRVGASGHFNHPFRVV